MSASGVPTTLDGGQLTRVVETDTLYVGNLAPNTTDADLNIAANGNGELKLGTSGKITRVLGDLNVDGAEVITGGTTMNGDVTMGNNDGDTIQIGGGTSDAATLACDLSVNNAVDIRLDRATGTGVLVLPNNSTGEAGAVRVNASNELQWWNGSAWATAGTSTAQGLQANYEQVSTITTNGTGGDLQFTVSGDGDFDVLNGTDNFSLNYGGAADQLALAANLTTFDINASGAATIDAGATSNFSTSAGDIDISAAAELDLDGGTNVAINAGNGNLTIAQAGTGTADIDAAGALSLNSSGGAINIGDDAVAQAINIGTGAAARTITMGNVTGATALDFNSGTGGITMDSTGTGDIVFTSADTLLADSAGVLELNSSGAAISIGNDDVDQGINIGTAGERTIAIGNGTGAAGVTVDAGTGGISLDSVNASNFTVSGADQDLTLGARGSTITLNESGQTSLTGFTATSIVGSLNELKAEISGVGTWSETADEAIAQYDIVSCDDAAATGKIVKANKDTANQNFVVGVATAAAAGGAACTIQSSGKVTVSTSDVGAWTVGQRVYMSGTDGEVTGTAPTSGISQCVGFSLDTGTAGTRSLALCIEDPIEM